MGAKRWSQARVLDKGVRIQKKQRDALFLQHATVVERLPQFRSAIVEAATGSGRSKYPASPIRVLIRRVPREPRAVLDSSRLQRLSSKTSIFARRWHLCPHLTTSSDQLVWVDLPCFFRRLPKAGILARRIPYSPSLSARPSSIVDRATGKIDGRHGPLFAPAGAALHSH